VAAKSARPGRTLIVFFLGLAIAYGLVVVAQLSWKPELGLDLQGGTRITLIAKGDPTAENLELARSIIDQRVNGSGVTEAEVVTQGGRFIVVEIPGKTRRDLVETVKRQAQLRFRLVACSDRAGIPCVASGAGADAGDITGDGDGIVIPPTADPTPTEAPTDAPTEETSPSGAANRAGVSYGEESPSADPSESPSESPSDEPSDDPSASPSAGASESVVPIEPPEGGPGADDPLTWYKSPNKQAVDAYNAFTCPVDGSPVNAVDDPDKPLVSCEYDPESGLSVKYLLSAALIEGTDLNDAAAEIPQQQVNYVVTLEFNGAGTDEFTKISQALVGTEDQFAIVLDGQVLSAPTMEALITDGRAQISGDFTQQSATSLATSLKYGALPIAFEDPSTETIGPSLAGDQLNAGLISGALGLGLVLIYCLFYYRGLGIVVVSSLLAAAAVVYVLVLLLSETAGFTLTLPGIAGLIIAVGVTADSFIIFFERIRDEMREGKTMRVAVETGWKRAKVTRLAAQVVSLLSAAVLYIFATGAVKGFGFALGLTSLVDLAILFWFTKPMVTWLGRFKFFNSGHRLSGLSKETLGMDVSKKAPAVAGGKA
jgi:preprotein translocase subunit SecD